MSSAHNPLDALQSLTQAQSVSRGGGGTVAPPPQAPAHMTRQMTDARNFALQSAVLVSNRAIDPFDFALQLAVLASNGAMVMAPFTLTLNLPF